MARPASRILRRVLPGPCAYCGRQLRSSLPGRPTRQATIDHILPRAWGRGFTNLRNYRLACLRCNQLRGNVGHCPAVLAITLQEARRFSGDVYAAARWLGVLGHG